jgi:long-chain fatty acid transport protein
MKKRLHGVVGALLSLSMASQAFALGTASYSSELISSKSLGMGGVGTAGATDDVDASYTNPAALTALPGTQVTIGGTYVNAKPAFTDAATGDVTGARATSVFIPNFGVSTQLLGGKLAAGLSVVTPYGLETHWDGDSPMRYAATDARLRIIDITPAVAYKVCDAFSVGAGADYYDTTDGQLARSVNLSGFGQPDAHSNMNATGGGWGYHMGVTLKPNEQNQIGLVYHSNVKMNLTGNLLVSGFNPGVFGVSQVTANVAAPVFIPQNLQLGYAYKPNDKWTIEADAAWYDWYAARQLGIAFTNVSAGGAALVGTGSTTNFNPRNTLNFAVGANYKASDVLQVRGGAYYEAASLPETAFDPAFADMPRYGLTVGGTYAFTSAFSADLAYNAVFFHSRSINGTQNVNGNEGYSGSFSSFANIVSANLNYKFDTHF